MPMPTTITIQQTLTASNDEIAAANQAHLRDRGIFTINIMAAPGAGKTSVILRLLAALPTNAWKGVLEADVASSVDTEKIQHAGFPAVQINTAGGCHLTAQMVQAVLPQFMFKHPGFWLIENIGNLICPSTYRLGEDLKLVIASVPEGDDKPLKYPPIFAVADVIVLNKIDYLAYTDFNVTNFLHGVRAVNPNAPVFQVSCKDGTGINALVAWLCQQLPLAI
jgi:hydrogenase nickel incorporation protein HypB